MYKDLASNIAESAQTGTGFDIIANKFKSEVHDDLMGMSGVGIFEKYKKNMDDLNEMVKRNPELA